MFHGKGVRSIFLISLLFIISVIVSSGCLEKPEFRIQSFHIAPEEVVAGEDVMIIAEVENVGNAGGTYRAIVRVDAVETASKDIFLAAGAREKIEFNISQNHGPHHVEFEDREGTFRVLRPAEIKTNKPVVAPNPAKIGEKTNVKMSIENVGEAEGTYPISLMVNGKVEQTKEITLKGGATEEVAFIISKDSPGSYSIEIGGQKETLKVVQVERLSTGIVKLLFAYSSTCPHCVYQKPIIREFEVKYPDVEVTSVGYSYLNSEQLRLIEGTSGHPVMVFHSGDHIRQIVGETSLYDLEKEYETFKGKLGETTSSKSTGGSKRVC